MKEIRVTTQPSQMPSAIPCAARPWTDFVHLDGVCACFYGGPAPTLAARTDQAA